MAKTPKPAADDTAAAEPQLWTLSVKAPDEVRNIRFLPGRTYRDVKPAIYDELKAKGSILNAFAQ